MDIQPTHTHKWSTPNTAAVPCSSTYEVHYIVQSLALVIQHNIMFTDYHVLLAFLGMG